MGLDKSMCRSEAKYFIFITKNAIMQEEVIWFQLRELWLDVGGRGAVHFGDAVILVDDDSQQGERVGVAQLVE